MWGFAEEPSFNWRKSSRRVPRSPLSSVHSNSLGGGVTGMGGGSKGYDNSCSFSFFHIFIARLSHSVIFFFSLSRCTRCLLVIRRLRSVPLGLWSFIKNNNPSAQRSGSRTALRRDVVGVSPPYVFDGGNLQSGWLCEFLSSWELVCVFQFVCLAAGNSHWLRNNYPHDLNIIQLISFISRVITQNGAGSLHPRRKARCFAGVWRHCSQLPLQLLLWDGCPRAASASPARWGRIYAPLVAAKGPRLRWLNLLAEDRVGGTTTVQFSLTALFYKYWS